MSKNAYGVAIAPLSPNFSNQLGALAADFIFEWGGKTITVEEINCPFNWKLMLSYRTVTR